ncbi:Ycf68 [Quillaja saponaria]|uniref:Ycf68 n=1 Tax=Quillaja saponaria TaxID=32244 RepID=A0AAD7P3K3_QUISA|nr:Ycf68 [Quillaja saponaria]
MERKTGAHLTTYLHRPRTTRSPLSFWGDGGIVPFEPFFHAFPGGLEKIAINRIFLILPSRKEEREILFPFRGDQEIGSSHKKNAWLINNSLLGLRPPSVTTNAPDQCNGMVVLCIPSLDSKWEQDGQLVRSSMDRTWTVVGVGGSPRVPLIWDPWGRGSSWALANSLMHYLLQPFERNAAKGNKIHGPTPSSPPRRNYEITPRTPSASRGRGPTIEPCFNKWNALAVRSQVGQ